MVNYLSVADYVFDPAVPGYAEINDEPSQAVPDMSMTVQQLLARHLSGSLPDISKEFYYDTDVSDPLGFNNEDPFDSPNFDMVDLHAIQDNLSSLKARREASDLPVDPPENPQTKSQIEENVLPAQE